MKTRDFLKVSVTSATAFAVSGLTISPHRTEAAELDISLVAEAAFKTMSDGKEIPVWQFHDPAGSGPGELPSGLLVQEGDQVNVTVTNYLDRFSAVNFSIPGVLNNSPPATLGHSYTYRFTAPEAGSYMFFDNFNGKAGRAMGLSGPLVVMPADGSNSLYSGGPDFDRQYTLVLNELDDRFNEAVHNGQPYEIADYEPKYFFVNGLSYPATAIDDDTLVEMGLGEDVAIRLINTGLIASPQHFHGNHVNIASRNRKPETTVIEKDTVVVDGGECLDVTLPVAQPGVYPLHTHFLSGVTVNGSYDNPKGDALIVTNAR